jgi:DNA mismatch repair protein MutS
MDKSQSSGHSYPDTPLFRQYRSLRDQVGDALLLFRLGDFYELFGDQAERASKILGLTLTTRDRNRPNPLPMCGIPARSLDLYLPRLIYQGHSVAIAEQTSADAEGEGLFAREIVRIVTRSTLIEDPALAGGNTKNGISIAKKGGVWYGACLDLSDGHLSVFDPAGGAGREQILDWIARKNPEEILIGSESLRAEIEEWDATVYPDDGSDWKSALSPSFLFPVTSAGAEEALGRLIRYVAWHQKSILYHLTGAAVESGKDILVLDRATLRHVDLLPNPDEKKRYGSLIEVLDRAKTPIGSRMVRNWLLEPDTRLEAIERKHKVLTYLSLHPRFPDQLGTILKTIGDFERMLGRIGMKGRSPRDMAGLRESLSSALALIAFPEWDELLPDPAKPELREVLGRLHELLEQALVDEPAVTLGEGPVIRDSFDSILADCRAIEKEGDRALLEIERAEREKTGIETLRIRYNQVTGYFIEVSKGQAKNVPPHYFRKQILTNVERFTIPDLIDFETRINDSRNSVVKREIELVDLLRNRILEHAGYLQQLGRFVGTVDALCSFHIVGQERGYVLPELRESGPVDIRNGRHPVLELRLPSGRFVPNDTVLEAGTFIVLTGPNMAGKSTYMRQVALIQIMAQSGCPVPADHATMPIVDRILTRVGASDHILEGESTFMVEMKEMSRILNEATARSLVLLDEVGRGTSTFDGMALAWSISEFIHDRIRCRTIFATHYHELHRLSHRRPDVRNQSVAVTVKEGKITFHHRIVGGHSSRSYGIDVARLAGIPERVVDRAFEILRFWNQQRLFTSVPDAEEWTPPDNRLEMPLFGWRKDENIGAGDSEPRM